VSRPLLASALSVAAVAAMVGCSFDFDSPSEVVDLRTLAIQADPPEILVTGAIPPVTLRALVVDPRDADREVTASWQACGTTTEHRCAEAPFALDLGGGTASLPVLEARLEVTRELLESVQRLDTLMGFGGLPITVELAVDAGDGGAEVSIKQVIAQAFLPEGTAPNENPSVPELLRADLVWPDDVVWPEDEVPVVAPGTELAVEPRAIEGDAETYSVFRFDLQVQELDEYLSYRFFASAGAWNRAETGGPPDAITAETTLASRWTAPDEAPADGAPVRLWVVVRDGRGGIAWATREVRVE
jgi:hypothetical protein